MENLYTIPNGVDFTHPELRVALAAIGIGQRSYLANGALCHVFTDLLPSRAPRQLRLVEGVRSKLSEVVGDATLWLLTRETARQVCASYRLPSGETIEQANADLVTT